MWLHIINNDKFFPWIKEIYETVAPDENVFTVNALEDGVPEGAELIDTESEFSKLLNSRYDWKGVIFNPLNPKCWKWLRNIPSDIPVVWYRWGGEAYRTHPYLKMRYLYMPETKKIVYRLNQTSIAREWYRGIRDVVKGRFRPLARVDCFVGPEYHEYELYRKCGLLSKRAKWLFGAVGYLENVCQAVSSNLLGPDVKIGNSAAPSNNHIEAFRWISKFDLSGRKVIVPLSYGDASYRDLVLRKGEEILGEHFEPLVDFLPLSEYNQLMDRCGFVIMNHLRQQAGGNITADLWRGSKVYMNETTSYKARREWGLSLELISSQMNNSIFAAKTQDEIDRDREILRTKLSKKAVLRNTKYLLDELEIEFSK